VMQDYYADINAEEFATTSK